MKNWKFVFNLLLPALVLYWGLLFTVTHRPAMPSVVERYDKIVHLGAFGLLSFMLALLFNLKMGVQLRWGIWVGTICVLYGAVDEYTQQFVPNRSSDINDLIADACGVLLGITAAYSLIFLRRYILSRNAMYASCSAQ
jgi:VanZ family protein